MTDDDHLARAIDLSRAGMREGEGGPFGAVVVHGDRVVGQGWNRVVASADPTAHAEMVALRSAAQTLGTFDLSGTVVYSSCEPCPMCWAAIAWARCDRLVYANTAEDAAAIGFDDAHLWAQMALSRTERQLDTTHRPSAEARAVFDAWRDDPDATPY